MSRISSLRRLLSTAILFLLAALLPGRADAQNDRAVRHAVRDAAVDVVRYWTPERMAAAKPMPLPELSGPARTGTDDGAAPTGLATIATSGAPGEFPREKQVSAAELAAATEPLFGTTPFNYTRYRLFPDKAATYKAYPYSAVGKLFFTIPGSGNFVCSASSINSSNLSVVWTAGHCVASPPGTFHTNVVFVPARWAGANPFGSWAANTLVTTNGWLNNGFFEYDLGAIAVNRGGSLNKKINDAVGFLGFVTNLNRKQHWHLQGYPAAPRNLAQTPPGAQFDGEHHEICAASWGTNDQPSGAGAGPQTIGVGCDKTGGTSGGPWVKDFSGVGGQTNLVNGNNSYRYTGPNPPENLKLFSPFFEAAANNVRNAAQGVAIP